MDQPVLCLLVLPVVLKVREVLMVLTDQQVLQVHWVLIDHRVLEGLQDPEDLVGQSLLEVHSLLLVRLIRLVQVDL